MEKLRERLRTAGGELGRQKYCDEGRGGDAGERERDEGERERREREKKRGERKKIWKKNKQSKKGVEGRGEREGGREGGREREQKY